MHKYLFRAFCLLINIYAVFLCHQCMEGSAWLVGLISSLYRILSPISPLSFCVSVLQGAGLPEVYVSDSKQEWHSSDNTQNGRAHRHTHTQAASLPHTHTHTRTASLTHTQCLSFFAPLYSLFHKHVGNGINSGQRAKRRAESIPTNAAEAR